MNIHAAGFSHRGTLRNNNEDAVLMHDQIFATGVHEKSVQGNAWFLVADGVGGAPAGEVASNFVLNRLHQKIRTDTFPKKHQLEEMMYEVNRELIDFGFTNPGYTGMATTLSGICFGEKEFVVLNAGDSAVFIRRDGLLSSLTGESVMSAEERSPQILNFFGGYKASLVPELSDEPADLLAGDIFVVTTDGLYHCFTPDQLNKILGNSKSIREKAELILEKSLEMGAPDNISCILIQVSDR